MKNHGANGKPREPRDGLWREHENDVVWESYEVMGESLWSYERRKDHEGSNVEFGYTVRIQAPKAHKSKDYSPSVYAYMLYAESSV